jgi:hypothetical protein
MVVQKQYTPRRIVGVVRTVACKMNDPTVGEGLQDQRLGRSRLRSEGGRAVSLCVRLHEKRRLGQQATKHCGFFRDVIQATWDARSCGHRDDQRPAHRRRECVMTACVVQRADSGGV